MKRLFSLFCAVLLMVTVTLSNVVYATEVTENTEPDSTTVLVTDGDDPDSGNTGTEGETGNPENGDGNSGGTEPEQIEPSVEPSEPVTEPSEPVIVWSDVYEYVYSTSDVNIRSGPGTEYDVIGLLAVNTKVQRVAVSDIGWSKLVYQDTVVYVNSKYLTTIQPVDYVDPTENPLKVDITENSIQAIADAVNSTNPELIVTNKSGVTYTITAPNLDQIVTEYPYYVLKNGANNAWYAIHFFSEIPEPYKSGTYWYIDSDVYYDYNLTGINKTEWNFTSSAYGTAGKLYITSSNIRFANFDIPEVSYTSDVRDYVVSFDTGFSDLTFDSTSDKDFVAPVPTYPGYKFDGWYLDSECTLPYTSSYVFTSDTVLYAKWIPYRTISFQNNIEGFEISSVQVLSGDSYFVPSFTYQDYEFVGAYTDPEYTNLFVDGTEITEDITIYLKFNEIEYNIGGLVNQLLGVAKGLDVIESQLWIILVVGLMYFVYKFFRIFF